MMRLVTDSGSMIPTTLRERFRVIVVPVTVTVDGVEYHEGADLPVADFYTRLAEGATVSTSAPSPGAILDAYRLAMGEGADEVLSIHTGSNYSATVSAATIAARHADVNVEVVDTGLASFLVTLCLWAAGDAVDAGRPIGDAVNAARAAALDAGSVFVVGVPELARRGGRFVGVSLEVTPLSIVELDGNGTRLLNQVSDIEAAIDVMADRVIALAGQTPLRVGVGDALRSDVAVALEERLVATPGIIELVRYQVGPSVGAHTGAGTVGMAYSPIEV